MKINYRDTDRFSFTLSRICTCPLYNPNASNCPSALHAQQVIRPVNFVLVTFFCSGDQRPKSAFEQLASKCEVG